MHLRSPVPLTWFWAVKLTAAFSNGPIQQSTRLTAAAALTHDACQTLSDGTKLKKKKCSFVVTTELTTSLLLISGSHQSWGVLWDPRPLSLRDLSCRGPGCSEHCRSLHPPHLPRFQRTTLQTAAASHKYSNLQDNGEGGDEMKDVVVVVVVLIETSSTYLKHISWTTQTAAWHISRSGKCVKITFSCRQQDELRFTPNTLQTK